LLIGVTQYSEISALSAEIKHSDTCRTQSSTYSLLDENCALLGCYAACRGNFFTDVRDNVLAPYSRVKNTRKIVPKRR